MFKNENFTSFICKVFPIFENKFFINQNIVALCFHKNNQYSFPNSIWWSAGLQIRTESHRNIRQRHCLRPVFVIIRKNQPVIKYIDAVKENIDDLSPIFLVVWVTIFEPTNPLDNVLPTVFWPFRSACKMLVFNSSRSFSSSSKRSLVLLVRMPC